MTLNLKEQHNEFLFVPLGGANEIGMNLNLYHYQGKWLVVDMGIGFAESSWLPGVDVIVPDIGFLHKIRQDIVGLIITHAHEDHLGAVPYLWEELECPVYATPYTAAFLRGKLKAEGVGKSKAKIVEVSNSAMINLAPFSIEMIGLTHSIPEMHAIAITTEAGTVMHTGDWKFDPDPLVGNASDLEALNRYGDNGVLAMVCDSTNVFVRGHSGSESTVRENLVKRIKECEGRVFVTTFASNVARLETLAEAAKESGRSIVLAGRSLWRVLEAARSAGYLKNTDFKEDGEAKNIPADKLMVICTGCQGEPMAALSKIARGENQNFRLSKGDSVIYSARVIPGNEKRINYLQNALVRAGVEVVTDHGDEIHVSGHPARDELAQMYAHVRPHIAIPVHGEARHLHEHAKLARSLQVPFAIESYNGAVIRLNREKPQIIGEVESGYVAIDGDTFLSVDSPVLRMRRKMQEAGIVVIGLAVDKDYVLKAEPMITAPGSLDYKDDAELFTVLREVVEEAVERVSKPTEEKVKQAVRTSIRHIFKQEVGKKPIISVEILRIGK